MLYEVSSEYLLKKQILLQEGQRRPEQGEGISTGFW